MELIVSVMRYNVMISLILLSIAFNCVAGSIEDCKEYAELGVPGYEGDLLCRTGYLLAYDSYYKTPMWVAEHLTRDKTQGDIKRTNKFLADPDLASGDRAELSDYKGSGYDRGHMAPAADMSWDKRAMIESFYLSNMVPQNPNMNQQIWRLLEEKVRAWAIERGDVYIYTGPIYDAEEVEVIGFNEVAVPTHLYKIIYDPKSVEAIAFIMPNKSLNPDDTSNYITTIDDIEQKVGLDFLSKLSRNVQDVVEKHRSGGMW